MLVCIKINAVVSLNRTESFQMNSKSVFPISLTEDQERLLREYARMLFDVNKQFNLISREDTNQVLGRHIAHCLCIAKQNIRKGAKVVDWGSGGGLPAIPLAIVWPDIEILAVDSIGKKTRAVDLFCRRLGIKNCRSWHGRAEQAEGSFHYSVSRATAPLADLWQWHQRVETSPSNLEVEVPSSNVWAPGLICLKGGDLQEEIRVMNHKFPDLETRVQPLALLKHDSYFETKCLVHVQKCGT